jgi:hypothetical protein
MPAIEGAVHTFAMLSRQGRLFAGSGSIDGEPARHLTSADAGETWQQEHRTQAPSGAFARYSHLAATGPNGSELFVSGHVQGEASEPFAYLRSAGSWRSIGGLPAIGFSIPLSLGEQLWVLHFSGDRGKGGEHQQSFVIEHSELVESDAPFPEGTRLVNWSLEPRDQEPDRLWVLSEGAAGGQAVHVAERLDDWALIAQLPELPAGDRLASITFLDNSVYLGSRRGAFFAIREVFEPL